MTNENDKKDRVHAIASSVWSFTKKVYDKSKSAYEKKKERDDAIKVAEQKYNSLMPYEHYLDKNIQTMLYDFDRNRSKNYIPLLNLDILPIKDEAIEAEKIDTQEKLSKKMAEIKIKCQEIKYFYDDKSNSASFSSSHVTNLIGQSRIYEETVKKLSSYSANATTAYNSGVMISQNIRVASFRNNYKKLIYSDTYTNPVYKFERPLSDMTSRELTVLKLIEILQCITSDDTVDLQNYISIIYNNGKNLFHLRARPTNIAEENAYNTIFEYIKSFALDPSTSCSATISELVSISEEFPDELISSYVRDELMGGNSLFKLEDGMNSKKLALSDEISRKSSNLLLGKLDRNYVYYKGEGSLLTIANPGAGKTQSNVLPNLLSYDGPAIVLDVKGTCYKHSADWRRKNVGPVYRFSPFEDAETSSQTNPLSYVRNDPKYIWEDSKAVANMLVIPQNNSHKTWDNQAKDLLVAIMGILLFNPNLKNQNMQHVLDVLSFPANEMDIFFNNGLKELENVPSAPSAMKRSAQNMLNLPDEQRATVQATAVEHLSSWQSYEVEQVTKKSDFSHTIFRDGSNSTLYICMPQDKISEHAALLRVILGSIINSLLKGLPDKDAKPIIFFLDELPQLGKMAIIDKSLELGREYGVKLWMFVQNKKQLFNISDNPDGLIENTDVNIYMNPSYDTAEELSQKLGQTSGLVDGNQKPLIDKAELMNGKYKDFATVLIRGEKPLLLEKVLAYKEFIDINN